MFGLTAGAVWVYLRRATFRPDELSYHLSAASLAFAVTTVIALLIQLSIVTSLPASVMAAVVWVLFAVALSLPFFFSGIVVSLALTRSPYPIGTVYGIDLLGAALGCVGALLLMGLVSGPSAVLWIAVMAAGGGLLFAGARLGLVPSKRTMGTRLLQHRWTVAGMLAALALANSLTSHGIRPTIARITSSGRNILPMSDGTPSPE
jgi:hypothetical protein